MKPAILFIIPIVLAALVDVALGQGFRGVGGSGRGSGGGWAQTRPHGHTNRHQFQRRSAAPSQHFIMAPAPSFRHRSVPRHGVFLWKPHWGSVFTPVPFTPVRFHFLHHPFHHYPRHPGILFIDVPRYTGTSLIAPYAPGAVYGDQIIVEESVRGTPERGPGQIAPFDPTPSEIVERMLTLARIHSDDVLYDLGSGDGRLVIAAAKRYGITAVGFEIDAGLVKLAQENAQKEGVEHLVEFRQQDFLTADLSGASVVTLYLSHDGNLAVRPQLLQQLKPGARVVSYTFDMGDWAAKIAEAYRDNVGNIHMIYFWEISGPQVFSETR